MVLSLAFIDSPEQILLILAIALLFFGPSKLPQLGSSVGKAIRAFREESREGSGPQGAPLTLAAEPLGCPTCGAEIRQGAAFCVRCGGALSPARAQG